LLARCLAHAAFLMLAVGLAHSETWRFTVIGDTPYSARERRELPGMLEAITERADRPAFIVHVGDFKHSRERCSDELFRDRLALFDAARAPFVFVPGDNEWTDCQRLIAGHYDEQERLRRLRALFFAEPRSLGRQRMALEQQSGAHPEHLRWRIGEVVFATLNVPGPDNNFGNGASGSSEFHARNPALLDWIDAAFTAARRDNARGVVLFMQGNPAFKHDAAGLAHAGYRDLLERIRQQTRAFAGQVLLVHGDTHWQRVDRPLRIGAQKLANFTRLESFGSPFMGWVDVTVDSDDAQLFHFTAHPLPYRAFP
jgi:hypothetical protein